MVMVMVMVLLTNVITNVINKCYRGTAMAYVKRPGRYLYIISDNDELELPESFFRAIEPSDEEKSPVNASIKNESINSPVTTENEAETQESTPEAEFLGVSVSGIYHHFTSGYKTAGSSGERYKYKLERYENITKKEVTN